MSRNTWQEQDISRTHTGRTGAEPTWTRHGQDMTTIHTSRTWRERKWAGHEGHHTNKLRQEHIYIYIWNKNVRRHNWFNKFDWWWVPIPVKGAEIPVPLPELPCRFIFERPDSYYAHIFLGHHMARSIYTNLGSKFIVQTLPRKQRLTTQCRLVFLRHGWSQGPS